jgi:CheY-like chemotaxis protein
LRLIRAEEIAAACLALAGSRSQDPDNPADPGSRASLISRVHAPGRAFATRFASICSLESVPVLETQLFTAAADAIYQLGGDAPPLRRLLGIVVAEKILLDLKGVTCMQGEPGYQLHHHVLIIDDNPDLAESLSWLLQFYGCRVEVALDGREGLRKAINGKPDVILIDIAMPGMTGYDVARTLRSTLSCEAVLIAQTAYGSPDHRALALSCGFNEHLIKPAEPNSLLQKIAAARSFHE